MPCMHWAAPPPSPCPHTRPHNCPHNCPHTWPGAFHKISHFFTPGAPVVGAAAASCQVHEMGVGGLLLRLAWQRPAAGWCYIGPDRRCLGRLACRELGRLPECLLKFGSERACAPPALSALNLGRLLRVVLPVKRDRSPGNPKVCRDYSSCAPDSVGACPFALRKGLPRRSWACPAAQRGVLNAEGASATTAPKCT